MPGKTHTLLSPLSGFSWCLVIPFSQLSENLSGHLCPNLSPGTALRAMLSLKMDTKSSKVGAEREGGEGWGGWHLLSGQKSYQGSATRGLIGGDASSRGLNECHRAKAWWRGCCQYVTCRMIKKRAFFMWVGGANSVCVPVSKAEDLRENLKAQTVRSTSG